MSRHLGTHRFDGLKIGNQPLQNTLDGYGLTISEHYTQHSDAIQTILKDLDGYAQNSTTTEHYNQQSQINRTILKDLDGYGHKTDFTMGPITISIDPSTGTDAAGDAYGFINSQALADAWGAFATMPAAARALPQNILHRVVFSLSDGTHTITDGSIFGDFSRLLFGWNNPNKIPSSSPAIPGRSVEKTIGIGHGHIAIRSANGYARVSGTSEMSCALGIDGSQVILSVDPGFTDDAYAGYFLRPIGGVSIFDVKAIRNHSGTTYNVAGRFNVSPTSVEIVQPAASLNLDALSRGVIQARAITRSAIIGCEIFTLEEIDLLRTSSSLTIFNESNSTALNGCRILGISWVTRDGFLSSDDAVLDGKSFVSTVVRMDGGYFRSASSESSTLVRRSTGNGIRAEGGNQINQPAILRVFKIAIDSNTSSGIFIASPGVFLAPESGGAKMIKGSGNGRYGVEISKGAYYSPGLLNFPPTVTSDYLTGTLGEISLDGSEISYSDINAEADKNLRGAQGSTIEGITT